jgi:hypothetical protein
MVDCRVADALGKLGMPAEFCAWSAGRTVEQVWLECERGDHMAALLTACGFDRKRLTLAAVACAEPAMTKVKGSTYALANAIGCARNWAAGTARLELVALAMKQAGEEMGKHNQDPARMDNPRSFTVSDFARYAVLAAVNSAIAPADASNAVYAASETGQAETTLMASSDRIRSLVQASEVAAKLGL